MISGVIIPFTGKANSKNSYLVCSHIAEGHSRPVLSVTATDQHLFSGSKGNCEFIYIYHIFIFC